METIKQIDEQYVAHTYKRFPVELVSGKGSILLDSEGKRYIDLGSGIGVTAFGIADEIWNEAVIAQLGKVQHTSNLYYTEPCAILAKRLCEKTGMKRVFFSNSGAEANECAIKVARKYATDTKGYEAPVILTLVNSFHGRTHTTLAATGQEVFHKLFNPLTPGFVHVAANDLAAFEKAVAKYPVAAILLEVVQGEGGVNTLDADYLKSVDAICKEKDILLMVDEVQTGNGRTGKLYGYMHFGITPDVVSTAKGLGGGLPIGATLLSDKVKDVLGYSEHGSTFGGNPIAAAGAVSIIDRLDDDFLAEVEEKGNYLREVFSSAEGVKSVSGLGLMVGIETVKPAGEVLAACMEKGVLCLTAKTKLRLLPALNIPMAILKEAVDVILAACK